jgi:4-alpha-glucanotransferase
LVKFLKRKGWLKEKVSTLKVLKACLNCLSASPAKLVLINLEDLWLETRPQNIPGTGKGKPNWKRKSRYNLEVFTKMPGVMGILKTVDSLRKRNGKAKNK